MTILVLAGGLSPERDVSIRSGRRVADALRAAGVDTVERDVDASLLAELVAFRPRAVIPLLHGAAGEDGALRDVLESLDLAYVGSRAQACRLAFDKPVAKTLIRRAGGRTPDAVALPHATFRDLGAPALLEALVRRIGLPLVVKPTKGGSALGAAVVRTAAELPAAMVGAFAYGDVALVEQFIAGTELAVSVLDNGSGPVALAPVEVVPDGGFYDYAARYTAGTTEFFVPGRLPEAVLAQAAEVAVLAHTTLGLRDWSRSDVVVDAAGDVWFLEVNVAPGMTETSTYPLALGGSGRDVGAVMAALVERAVARLP
ncbi:MAG: D-alanine--D-alanine ligase [Actinomycetota bacterium]|nr:MAG: D-alanine--D-alanine ligase [Actinomycetota bacterium]